MTPFSQTKIRHILFFISEIVGHIVPDLTSAHVTVLLCLQKVNTALAFTYAHLMNLSLLCLCLCLSLSLPIASSGLSYINDKCCNYSHVLSPSAVSQRSSDS